MCAPLGLYVLLMSRQPVANGCEFIIRTWRELGGGRIVCGWEKDELHVITFQNNNKVISEPISYPIRCDPRIVTV